MISIVYKIRRPDGMFSNGGQWPSFSKTGKVWKRQRDLTCHLNQLSPSLYGAYDNCDVVAYKLTETEVETKSVGSYLAERIAAKRERELKELQHRQERERQERYDQYLQLKQEFGK